MSTNIICVTIAAASVFPYAAAASGPTCGTFDGSYIGVHAGVSQNNSSFIGQSFTEEDHKVTVSSRGIEGGILIGNISSIKTNTLDNPVYLGIEVGVDRNNNNFTNNTIRATNITTETDIGDIKSVAATETSKTSVTIGTSYGVTTYVGYPLNDSILAYASIGVHATQVKISTDNSIQANDLSLRQISTSVHNKIYAAPGIGVQISLNKKWSARISAVYHNLNKLGGMASGLNIQKLQTSLSVTYKIG